VRSPRPPAPRARPPLAWRRPRLRPARLRRWRRSPVAFWLIAAALACAAAGLVGHTASGADELRRSLGETRQVPVARHSLDRGDQIDDGDVDWRELPTAAVPDDVAEQVDGRTVSQPINEHEPIADSRLAPDGIAGVAALLPAGSAAIAVPKSLGAPPVEVGDRIDLLAAGDASLAVGHADTVARDGMVVAVDDDVITVAIDEDQAPEAVAALATGAVVIALVSAAP
jgi:Flp pilus assembly protein CpaB